jgi:guanylate cyclase
MELTGEFGKSNLTKIQDAVSIEGDSDDLKQQKSLLVAFSLLVMPAGIIWGAIYLVFDEPRAAIIPLAYTVLSLTCTLLYVWIKNYELYRTLQLLLILLAPFFLMLALGGFVGSSSIILWSVLCPFGALLFAREKARPRWMMLYLSSVVVAALLQPYVRDTNNLPRALIDPVFFILNIGAVTGIAFLLINYYVRERKRAFGLLREEQQRSESLLLNMLPAEIAPRLKADNRTIADYFESASVLFADIVGSTPLFAEMKPGDAVDWLNEVFSLFDRLVERHDLEKIRTIGDSYMVASGAPRPRPDHAQAIARLALEMSREVAKLAPRNGHNMEIRVGINSGPLVGGVIGETKFHYDLWGDTVNTASRMESHGVPGKIQINEPTYQLLRDEFECERRGIIQIKGKGEMETWFVVGEKM